MPTPLETLRSAGRAAAMGSLTLGMLGGVSVHERLYREEQRHALFQDWMQTWASGVLRIFGVRAELAGELPPPAAGPRLVVANHRSPIDILLMLRCFGGVVLSRADLARWPVLGLAARRAETIFVDRADTMSGVLAVRTIRDRLAQGRTVIVFPEGTTVAGDEVRPFQQGAFAAARGLDVQVVPVGIAYQPGSEFLDETFVQHMTRIAARPTTRLSFTVGAPRPLQGPRKEFGEALRAEVQTLVHASRAQLHGTRSG